MDSNGGQAVITGAGLLALITALTLSAGRPAEASAPDAARTTPVRQTLLELPLHFEPNLGQTDGSVRFLSRAGGISLYLTPSASILALKGCRGSGSDAAVRMELVGADPAAAMEGVAELPGKVNYLRGSDPMRWKTNVPTFAQVRVQDAWPGIDLVHHGNGRNLEHDFVVAPGADPGAIRVAFSGAESLRIDAAGDLVLATAAGPLVERAPLVYQQHGCARQSVAGRFVLHSEREVGFEVGAYDRARELVIDPVLVYSTYLGGSGSEGIADEGTGAIAADASDHAYVAGGTTSFDFPTTTGAYDMSINGGSDIFVAKLSAQGDSLVYSTYIGGTGSDVARSIAVDGAGNAFVTGWTDSSDFPISPGAFDQSLGGTRDAFVLKLDPTGGALVYSTYLGGSISAGGSGGDSGTAIAIDSAGNAHVGGQTYMVDFPTTPGAFDRSFALPGGNANPTSDGFVTKLNPAGTALVYSTYLGGPPWQSTAGEFVSGIAVGASGNAYVTGRTNSKQFPVTQGAYDRSYNLKIDAFVTKLNPTGSALVYSTYLGGSEADYGESIGLDGAGNAVVSGNSSSTNFPTTAGAFDRTHNGALDVTVTKVNAAGSALVYSTYLGGSGAESGTDVVLDTATGAAFVGGSTHSSNFPTTPDAFDLTQNGNALTGDPFLTQLSATGGVLYSTYFGGTDDDELGGVALNLSGNHIFLFGGTKSIDLPLAGSPLQPANAGTYDQFAARFDF